MSDTTEQVQADEPTVEQPTTEAPGGAEEVRDRPVTHQPHSAPPAYLMTKAPYGTMRLTDWKDEVRAAWEIAGVVNNTGYVPQAMRGDRAMVTATMLTGYELGLSPLASLRSVYMIHGTPAMYAKAIRALVMSKGHDIEVTSQTNTRVVARGRRAGASSWTEVVWDMDRARTAGITNNKQYQLNPKNMLTARATAELCWLVAPDELYGIGASVEELEADPEGEYAAEGDPGAQSAAPARRTAQRKAVEKAQPLAEPEPDRAAPSDKITPAQQKVLQSLLRQKGFTVRERGLGFIENVIQMTCDSSKDLTAVQARQVIEALTQAPDAPTTEPQQQPTPG